MENAIFNNFTNAEMSELYKYMPANVSIQGQTRFGNVIVRATKKDKLPQDFVIVKRVEDGLYTCRYRAKDGNGGGAIMQEKVTMRTSDQPVRIKYRINDILVTGTFTPDCSVTYEVPCEKTWNTLAETLNAFNEFLNR